MTRTPPNPEAERQRAIDALRAANRLVITSHARPDGDATGSQLALTHALRDLGKRVSMISRDLPPPYLRSFPGAAEVEVTDHVDGDFDAAVILECGSLDRTEIAGLERYPLINIDHHLGNGMYGTVNWFDVTAAACGELVFELVQGLGVPLSPTIASALYVTILTDTGAFHHGNITARTFDICRQITEAGVSPAAVAATVYQNGTLGKLRLTGALLDRMELHGDGRVAVLRVDDALLSATGGDADDMDGLINLPLAASGIQAVVLFKELKDALRVSLRSKGTIDVREVALAYGGGGHRNAAGCSIPAPLESTGPPVIEAVVAAVAAAARA